MTATLRYNFSGFKKPIFITQTEVESFISAVELGCDEKLLERIKSLSSKLRERMRLINARIPAIDGKSTNPFVLAAYAELFGTKNLTQVDDIIAAAKVFSSIETAAGRVVEDVLPPFYGWTQVNSPGHTVLSEIDSAKVVGDTVYLVALKSGPMCINDSMVSQIANAISKHWKEWADHWGVKKVRYVVGMNYSTASNSNKKDWHIVRLSEENISRNGASIISSCIIPDSKRPFAVSTFSAQDGEYQISVETLQGKNLWEFIADDPVAFLEICWAMMLGLNVEGVRANNSCFNTNGMAEIIKFASKVQSNATGDAQKQWLLLFARHFVDEMKLSP